MGNSPSTSTTPTSSPNIENAHAEQCTGEDCKPEPYNPNLVGTVGYFTRSVVVCSGQKDWPKKVEKTPGNFVNSIAMAIKHRDDIDGIPKVIACSEPSSGDGFDIYVYPDEVKYIGVKEEDIPVFVEDQLVKGTASSRLKHISVSGTFHVLVCVHATRDKRCGRSGPQIIGALQELVDLKGMHEVVKVDGSSHVGGHKYAGVVVVFPHGDYYGYMGAKNVEQVLDGYIDPKKPKAHQFWRGRMGLDETAQALEAGLSVPSGSGKKKDKEARKEEKKEKKEKKPETPEEGR